MKPEEVFKRYDIRGEYPEELDEEFAERLGKALGTFAQKKYDNKVVVCRDNKETSKPLKEALIEGITSSGVDVVDVGVGPTDFAAWSSGKENSVSVQVTSSHMPLNFNGFKFMYPEGNGFVNSDLYTVQDLFREENFSSGEGTVENRPDMLDNYKSEIVEFASSIGSNWGKKVVVDSLGGTGRILPELLEELGVEVVDISSSEKPYRDPPRPRPEKLDDLKNAVEREDADIGISNDLDADRITVYYNGRFLTGDELFCVLAQLVEGPIVASIDTTQGLEDLRRVEHTRVGDPFVMDKALEIDAKLAGEPNGHYSFTDFVGYNSGILAALILSGLNLEEKLEKIPEYTVKRENVRTNNKEQIIESLKEKVGSENIISELDGVKFREGNAEVLVRPSGSSPKVRVIAESEKPEDAEKTLNIVVDRINRF